jgi:excinuclease ABC subunit A
MAPVKTPSANMAQKEISKFLAMGYSRIHYNQEISTLDENHDFPKKGPVDFEIVIDRILIKEGVEKRLSDSVEHSLKLGQGAIVVLVNDDQYLSFSENLVSEETGETFPDLEPRLFSFNSPIGACPKCNGLGESKEFSQDSMLFDENLGVLKGAIEPLTKKNNFLYKMVECFLKAEGYEASTPLKNLKKVFLTLFGMDQRRYTHIPLSLKIVTLNLKSPFQAY